MLELGLLLVLVDMRVLPVELVEELVLIIIVMVNAARAEHVLPMVEDVVVLSCCYVVG